MADLRHSHLYKKRKGGPAALLPEDLWGPSEHPHKGVRWVAEGPHLGGNRSYTLF